MKTSRLLCLAFGYLFAFCLTPTSVYAAVDVSYDPILPLCINVFSDPNCWVGGVVPGTSDNAIFNTAAVAPYTVNFTAAASNDNTIVHTDNLILDLGTNTYSLTTDLTVGELMGDVANLSITDGTVSDQSGHIGLDRGSTGTVTVDGIGSTWNNNLLEIGIHGNGTLTVKNEGVVTSSVSYLSAAGNPGAIGTATVDGAGSLWNSGGLQVGFDLGSHGYLNIINGGTVQSTRASLAFEEGFATVTIDGADSSWDISDYFLIGGNGAATLNITNGGTVTSAGGVAIANRTGSQGLVTVDGVGSSWTNNGALVIGGRVGDMIDSSGDGFLTIKNGGLISNTDAYLGKYSRGAVTVDGTGSRWNNSGNLVIGDYGTGNLYIQNGGTVSSTNGYLGRSTGTAGRFFYTGSGTATVDGIGSTWNNSGSLYVGGDENTAVGTGVVIASGGGSVNVGNMLKVWKTGSINFSDSTLDTGTLVNLGNINIGSGNTEVHGEVANSGVISVYGNGTATFHDNVWINGYADIHVGNGSSADFLGAVTTGCIFSGTGSLSFQGDLSPSCYKKVDVGGDMTLGIDSRTIMKIAGISQGYGYDSIDVVGNLFLDGELDVVLPNPNFSVSLGDSFDLFVADTINGSFKTLNLSSPGDGLGWQLDILTDAIGTTDIVRLDVVSAVPVPTAIWLFGSGLLGLIVIGRKKKAA